MFGMATECSLLALEPLTVGWVLLTDGVLISGEGSTSISSDAGFAADLLETGMATG